SGPPTGLADGFGREGRPTSVDPPRRGRPASARHRGLTPWASKSVLARWIPGSGRSCPRSAGHEVLDSAALARVTSARRQTAEQARNQLNVIIGRPKAVVRKLSSLTDNERNVVITDGLCGARYGWTQRLQASRRTAVAKLFASTVEGTCAG